SFVPGPSSLVLRYSLPVLYACPGVPTRRPDGQGAKDKGPRTKDQGRVPNNGTQTVRWLPIPNPTVGKAPTVATPSGMRDSALPSTRAGRKGPPLRAGVRGSSIRIARAMIVKRDRSRTGEVGGDGGGAGRDPPRQAAGVRGGCEDADGRGRIRGGEGVAGAASRADGDHAVEVIAARAGVQVRASGLQDDVRSGVQVEAGVNVDFIDLRRILDGEDVGGGGGLRLDEEFPVAARSSA